MTIENLVGLTRGEILTEPNVSAFEGFCFDAMKVQRGDLFIALDRTSESIDTAISQGAYGVLIDDDFTITDKEIAWIKVQNINMALMRLMRFQSSYKKLVYVAISSLQENILKSMALAPNTLILSKIPLEAFMQIMNIEDNSYVFCSSESTLQKIAPIHESIFTERNTTNQKNGSIFISSFIHENEYYQKVPISPLFVPALSGILSFMKKNKIEFSLEHFQPIANFQPIFVDTSIFPKPFGSTRRALIVESNEELFKFEAKLLLKMLPPNYLLICKPIKSKSNMDANFLYKHESDLKELSSYSFRYALILGDKEALIQALMKEEIKRYPSLF